MISCWSRETAVATALGMRAAGVDRVAAGRWAFTLANGTALAAQAQVGDGWLLLDAPLDGVGASPPDSWELLRWNAMLPGGARFALRPRLRARVDLPLDDGVDLSRRVLDACAGLEAARARLVHGPEGEDAGPPGVAGAVALSDLCRESGWAFVEREEGRLAVELDVPGAFQQAAVEPHGGGVVVAVPVLEAAAAPSSVCEQAVGVLLLRVCGIVRMARVVAEARNGYAPARFEVVFGSPPCAAELTHAFAALSVACRIAGREASVLWRDEGIARAYLGQCNPREEDLHGTGSNDDPAGE
jgi:hypothetical protein